jgi:hypothetical protein
VIVVLQTSSCAAAALCRTTRYLSREAPRLPLPACPTPDECPCKFKHFQDRRNGPRRNADMGSGSDSGSDKPPIDKRKTRGRRSRDKQ